MNKINEKSITYIKNDKYLFNIIKVIPYPTKIEKIGLTIYKKTLEINTLNKDSIDLLLNNTSNFNESCANIGFVNILGFLCFIYASNNDIKEKANLNGNNKPSYKICRIDNLHCFVVSYNISQDMKKKVKEEFEKIGKFLISEEIFFSPAPFRFDFDISNQLKTFQDNYFKYKIIEKFQYNENYMPPNCLRLLTPIVKGFYKNISYNNLFNDKDHVNAAVRFKIYDNNKYLVEIELFITPTNNQKMFQNIFYIYFNESSDKFGLLKRIIETWINNINNVNIFKDNKKNIINKDEGLIINLFSNVMDDKNEEIKNKNFINEINNIKNFEIINLKKNKDLVIENELNKNIDKLKNVGYNYKYNNIDYNSQNKLLIIVGNDFDNLFSLIKIVSYIMYSIYLNDRGFQKNVINNAKEEIIKCFKHFHKKIQKQKNHYFEKLKINVVTNEEEFKNMSKNTEIEDEKNINITSEEKEEQGFIIINTKEEKENNSVNEQEKQNNEQNNNNENNINKDDYKKNDKNIIIENIDLDDYDIKDIDNENNNCDANNISSNENININQIISDTNKPTQNNNNNKKNKTITLFIGTFNVNALDSDLIKTTNLDPFLFPEKIKNYFRQDNFPTFYCIGLEETIELNPKNVLIKPKNKAELWEERISNELQKRYNYFLQYKEQLVGVLFLFFVKSTEMRFIKKIHVEKLKSGFIGLGNKGCCFFDFEYKGYSYGFCSGHLPAGQKEKNFKDRKEIFKHILDFRVNNNDYEFYKNDFFFIFGDLNFRTNKIGLIDLQNHIKCIIGDMKGDKDGKKKKNFRFSLDFNLNKKKEKIKKKMNRFASENVFKANPKNMENTRNSNSNSSEKKNKQNSEKKIEDYDLDEYSSNTNINNEIRENVMNENIFIQYFFNEFLEEEELENLKEKELFVYDVSEAEITFPPTYKYVKGTNFYNLSKRVPSWTDRILYKKSGKISNIFYDRIDINLSDHKPIAGLFEITIDS